MKKTPNDRFKVFREHLNLSPTQFASEVGVSQSLIAKIETNQKPLSKNVIEALNVKYNLDTEWLINGVGEMNFVMPEKAQTNSNSLPWREEAYTILKEQVKDYKEKYAQVMDMMSKMIDRQQVGKLNGFALSTGNRTPVAKSRN